MRFIIDLKAWIWRRRYFYCS